jgi:hypothetical protein
VPALRCVAVGFLLAAGVSLSLAGVPQPHNKNAVRSYHTVLLPRSNPDSDEVEPQNSWGKILRL